MTGSSAWPQPPTSRAAAPAAETPRAAACTTSPARWCRGPSSDWAEQAYASLLQPAGGATDVWDGYYFRYYPSTQAHVGVKDGNVYYKGPATGGRIEFVTTLAIFLARAQAAGF